MKFVLAEYRKNHLKNLWLNTLSSSFFVHEEYSRNILPGLVNLEDQSPELREDKVTSWRVIEKRRFFCIISIHLSWHLIALCSRTKTLRGIVHMKHSSYDWSCKFILLNSIPWWILCQPNTCAPMQRAFFCIRQRTAYLRALHVAFRGGGGGGGRGREREGEVKKTTSSLVARRRTCGWHRPKEREPQSDR